MDEFIAPVGKLTPFSHFLDGENKWVVTPDQPEPATIQATSVNLAGMPQIGAFDPEKEVLVVRLGSVSGLKKKRRKATAHPRQRKVFSGIQLALELL